VVVTLLAFVLGATYVSASDQLERARLTTLVIVWAVWIQFVLTVAVFGAIGLFLVRTWLRYVPRPVSDRSDTPPRYSPVHQHFHLGSGNGYVPPAHIWEPRAPDEVTEPDRSVFSLGND